MKSLQKIRIYGTVIGNKIGDSYYWGVVKSMVGKNKTMGVVINSDCNAFLFYKSNNQSIMRLLAGFNKKTTKGNGFNNNNDALGSALVVVVVSYFVGSVMYGNVAGVVMGLAVAVVFSIFFIISKQ